MGYEFYSLATIVLREAAHDCWAGAISSEAYHEIVRLMLVDIAHEENA